MALDIEQHSHDLECTVNPATLCCEVCGVDHSDECLDCGGRGFHKETCFFARVEVTA